MRVNRDVRQQVPTRPAHLPDQDMHQRPMFRMRRRKYRIEGNNNADAGLGFDRNKVRVLFRLRTPVSAEVNLKAHFASFQDQQAPLPCSASRSIW